MRINHIIKESKNNIMLTETRTYKLWESAGQKILEANLTANQITQLFQQIEQGATASGDNRTVLGKGKDVASAVNKAWEDLKTKVQNSGPIKNVDAAYDQAAEKLKQATGGDAGVMKYVQKYRDFAKKHPIAQGLIYSALIAAAGISGAGLGGAAALGLLKMTDKLLQGQKFSSAAYQGAKTGAMAYAAGQIGKAMKGNQQTDAPQSTAQTPKTDIATPVDHTDKVDNVTKTTKDVAKNIAPTDTHVDNVKHVANAAKDTAVDKFAGHPTEYNGTSWDNLTPAGKEAAMKATQSLDAQADAGHAALKAARAARSGADDHASNTASAAANHTATYGEMVRKGQMDAYKELQQKFTNGEIKDYWQMDSAIHDAVNDNMPNASLTMRKATEEKLKLAFERMAAQDSGGKFQGSGDEIVNAINQHMAHGSNTAANVASTGSDIVNKGIKGAFDEVKEKFARGEIKDYNDWQNAIDVALEKNPVLAQNPTLLSGSRDELELMLEPLASKAGADMAGEVARHSVQESKQLSDSQISTLFYLTSIEHRLNEGVWDSVKGAVGKGLGKAANAVKTTGHNLTTKVTADKLMKAWKSAGSPTDSNEVASLLANSGVSQEVIDKVFSSMKIPTPKAAKTGRQEPTVGDLSKMNTPSATDTTAKNGKKSNVETLYAKVKSQINQLNTKQRKSLAIYIQKQLGTA